MTARRSFLARFGAAAAAFGLGSSAAGAQPPAPAPPAAAAPPPDRGWQPAREARDDWFDRIPGRHRMFFDAVSTQGVREANVFAVNYFNGSKTEYGLDAADLAVVICLRHVATPFAFNDVIWSKYGTALAESIKFTDARNPQPPVANPYKAQLEAHVKRGVHFAVCDMASHRFAGVIARSVEGGNADAIYKEMTANAIGNAHFVAAGIIAVNRAQERGYAIAYAG